MTVPTPVMDDAALHSTARGSSFHMAMLLLPKHKRKALLTLYALCRVLDDTVDDAPDPVTAKAGLAQWETELQQVFHAQKASTPLTQDFLHAHQRYGFMWEDMQAMLAALHADAEGQMLRPSRALLTRYCYGVASAVGLMSMRIFGCDNAHARPFAIALGHALQLTNILRDVQTDATIGRIYLPQDVLPADITVAQLCTDTTAALPACAALAQQAQAYFIEADSHGIHLPPRAIAPALAMRDVYAAYWRHLQAQQWRAPEQGRIRLSGAEKAALAQRASSYMLGRFKPVILD